MFQNNKNAAAELLKLNDADVMVWFGNSAV